MDISRLCWNTDCSSTRDLGWEDGVERSRLHTWTSGWENIQIVQCIRLPLAQRLRQSIAGNFIWCLAVVILWCRRGSLGMRLPQSDISKRKYEITMSAVWCNGILHLVVLSNLWCYVYGTWGWWDHLLVFAIFVWHGQQVYNRFNDAPLCISCVFRGLCRIQPIAFYLM